MYTCAPACVHISSCSLFIAAHGSCSFFVHYPECIRVIVERELVPATGLVLGVHFGGCPPKKPRGKRY